MEFSNVNPSPDQGKTWLEDFCVHVLLNVGQAALLTVRNVWASGEIIYRWVVGLLGGRPAPEWDEVGVTGESIDWRP